VLDKGMDMALKQMMNKFNARNNQVRDIIDLRDDPRYNK
jgi:hypothetical protein